ncbi:hypothetical protein JD844_017522 [Phrynosoma platyrhinos]|uniref:Uncharacterized protein n=1 Tax=Phrynosoma platyrhinos TaxID=52577 RepID=A0ABQ7SM63_PHRPL|nr:hypothetical protein JD844_017522 [Phrynosoma platyrhinos]
MDDEETRWRRPRSLFPLSLGDAPSSWSERGASARWSRPKEGASVENMALTRKKKAEKEFPALWIQSSKEA